MLYCYEAAMPRVPLVVWHPAALMLTEPAEILRRRHFKIIEKPLSIPLIKFAGDLGADHIHHLDAGV